MVIPKLIAVLLVSTLLCVIDALSLDDFELPANYTALARHGLPGTPPDPYTILNTITFSNYREPYTLVSEVVEFLVLTNNIISFRVSTLMLDSQAKSEKLMTSPVPTSHRNGRHRSQ